MTAQHRLRPGNDWDITVDGLARRIEEERDRAVNRHPSYDPVHLRALRLVDQGRIGATDGILRRRHGELSEPVMSALATLLRDGYVELADSPDPRTGWRTAVLTDAGAHCSPDGHTRRRCRSPPRWVSCWRCSGFAAATSLVIGIPCLPTMAGRCRTFWSPPCKT